MSDTADDEVAFLGHQLLNQSRTASLRTRMESFVGSHQEPTNFKVLRGRTKTGESLSEIVRSGRDERLE